MDNRSLSTLIRSNNIPTNERWYPIAIETLRQGFALDRSISDVGPLINNLAYSLQMLELISKELSEMIYSSVLTKMVIKNYAVTSIGILEGVFTNLIKSHGLWPKTDRELILTTESTGTSEDGTEVFIKNEISRSIDPVDVKSMTLYEMINVLRDHPCILNLPDEIYDKLHQLRGNRNRVHLSKGEDIRDSDYNAFEESDINRINEVLYPILCSPKVTKPQSIDNYYYMVVEVD